MSRGSGALRALEAGLAQEHPDQPLTTGFLLQLVREAADYTETMEHDDYMGMDQ